jgi:hypothetical protein
MRTRTVLIYLGLLALLAGYFAYFEGVRGKARIAEEERARLVFQVDEGKITALKVSSAGGKPMALTKDNGHWRLTGPIESPADDFALRGLVAALAGLKHERQVEAAAQDLRPYGLDQPSLHLVFEATGAWHDLRIGAKTPVGDYFYASGDEEARVILIPASQERALHKSLFDLRGKEPFTLKSDEVERIEIVRPRGTLVLTRSEGKGWQSPADQVVKIKSAKVEALLNRLTWLRASQFVEEVKTASARFSLNPPRARLILSAKDRRETLALGASESSRGIYAKSNRLPGTFVIDNDIIKNLPASLGDLEDRALFVFDTPEQVARVALVLSGNAGELERQGNTWTWAEGGGGKPPEAWRVESLLRKVQELEYLEGPPPKGSEPGDTAHLRLVLTSRGGERLGAISAGAVPSTETKRGVVWFAKGPEALKPYLVTPDALRGLEQGVTQVLKPES